MNRTTIDFGIDLGTTNSAVAVYTGNHGEPTRIIKNTTDGNDADITPSAVYLNKKGDVRVGLRAKSRFFDEETGEDVHIEFKRGMGTDRLYKFKSSGQSRRPEELSAEILKSLRADVQQRTGELVEASVIFTGRNGATRPIGARPIPKACCIEKPAAKPANCALGRRC